MSEIHSRRHHISLPHFEKVSKPSTLYTATCHQDGQSEEAKGANAEVSKPRPSLQG